MDYLWGSWVVSFLFGIAAGFFWVRWRKEKKARETLQQIVGHLDRYRMEDGL